MRERGDEKEREGQKEHEQEHNIMQNISEIYMVFGVLQSTIMLRRLIRAVSIPIESPPSPASENLWENISISGFKPVLCLKTTPAEFDFRLSKETILNWWIKKVAQIVFNSVSL